MMVAATVLVSASASSNSGAQGAGGAVSVPAAPPMSTSALSRLQSSRHDVVIAQRAGSDITEILLSLPRAKYEYSAEEYVSATIAVRDLTTLITTRLSRYGAMVGYTDSQGTPTLSVTVLAEHAKTVLPLVVKGWSGATFRHSRWKALLAKHAAEPTGTPAERMEQALTGLHTDLPLARLKHDPRRFHVSRTLLVVGGPWSPVEVFSMLGDMEQPLAEAQGPRELSSKNQDHTSLSQLANCDALVLSEAPGSRPATIFLPVRTVPVSGSDWPAARVAIAVAGTGYDSRMSQDLRQVKGWAYGAGIPVHYRPTFTMGLARTRVQPRHALAAAQRLDAALASLRSTPPLAAELAQAKLVLSENYWDNRENLVHEVAYIADFVGAGMTLAQFEQYPERLANVSVAEVQGFSPDVSAHAIVVPPTGPTCRVLLPARPAAP